MRACVRNTMQVQHSLRLPIEVRYTQDRAPCKALYARIDRIGADRCTDLCLQFYDKALPDGRASEMPLPSQPLDSIYAANALLRQYGIAVPEHNPAHPMSAWRNWSFTCDCIECSRHNGGTGSRQIACAFLRDVQIVTDAQPESGSAVAVVAGTLVKFRHVVAIKAEPPPHPMHVTLPPPPHPMCVTQPPPLPPPPHPMRVTPPPPPLPAATYVLRPRRDRTVKPVPARARVTPIVLPREVTSLPEGNAPIVLPAGASLPAGAAPIVSPAGASLPARAHVTRSATRRVACKTAMPAEAAPAEASTASARCVGSLYDASGYDSDEWTRPARPARQKPATVKPAKGKAGAKKTKARRKSRATRHSDDSADTSASSSSEEHADADDTHLRDSNGEPLYTAAYDLYEEWWQRNRERFPVGVNARACWNCMPMRPLNRASGPTSAKEHWETRFSAYLDSLERNQRVRTRLDPDGSVVTVYPRVRGLVTEDDEIADNFLGTHEGQMALHGRKMLDPRTVPYARWTEQMLEDFLQRNMREPTLDADPPMVRCVARRAMMGGRWYKYRCEWRPYDAANIAPLHQFWHTISALEPNAHYMTLVDAYNALPADARPADETQEDDVREQYARRGKPIPEPDNPLLVSLEQRLEMLSLRERISREYVPKTVREQLASAHA